MTADRLAFLLGVVAVVVGAFLAAIVVWVYAASESESIGDDEPGGMSSGFAHSTWDWDQHRATFGDWSLQGAEPGGGWQSA